MKKIVFASGKGGAGKTSVSTAFFKEFHADSVMVDCDVDASNCYITLDSEVVETVPFMSGYKYVIDEDNCLNCGRCARSCVFNAIVYEQHQWSINGYLCEGCGACMDSCGVNAIKESENYCGDMFDAKAFGESAFFYARLHPGEDNSGKLIAELKNRAFTYVQSNPVKYMVFDAPPGIGCPVIATLNGADVLVIVIEATRAGFSDAEKLIELVKDKKMEKYLIINKGGIDPLVENDIGKKASAFGIKFLGTIPYHKGFYELLQNRQYMTDITDKTVRETINTLLHKIIQG